MKNIKVVAAVILNGDKIFSAERAYGFLKGKWEFPGGKVKEGETPEYALKREIQEELNTTISVDSFFMNVAYDYPDFHLDMDVFLCHTLEGALQIEKGIHEGSSFLSIDDLREEEWCPADALVVKEIMKRRDEIKEVKV